MAPTKSKARGQLFPDDPKYKYDGPAFRPSSQAEATIEAKIRLAHPNAKALEFTMTVNELTSFAVIREAIIKRHGGSIVEVYMCLNQFQKDECVDTSKLLKDYGITTGQCLICYDFEPFSGPLLSA
ncbi:hypothetical protein CSUI_004225 [Cystoisospora suis]|uniref:Ubiquitin-like protein ATG12 n=1 Tax=Cystoisospora suis TaxID=483139 RepID=A0A2C6L1V2_9APIC|nr:hypothetical protein CSUI_004225 [Cystoisospora suis]